MNSAMAQHISLATCIQGYGVLSPVVIPIQGFNCHNRFVLPIIVHNGLPWLCLLRFISVGCLMVTLILVKLEFLAQCFASLHSHSYALATLNITNWIKSVH